MGAPPNFKDHPGGEFEKGGRFDPDRPQFTGRALRVLARNAVSAEDKLGAFSVVLADSKGLVEDASDVTCALYWIMSYAGFVEASRSWVSSVFSLIEQDGGESCEITDPEFAAHLNCSERTVMRKRKGYKAEAAKNGFDVLFIDEGDYDHKAGKNRPTRYGLACYDLLVRVVERARGSRLWERGETRRAIMEEAKAQFLQEPDTPSPNKNRKGKTRSVESEIGSLKKTMRTLATKLGDLERKRRAGNVRQMWNAFKPELDEAVEAGGLSFAAPQTVEGAEDEERDDNLVTPSVTPSACTQSAGAVTPLSKESPDRPSAPPPELPPDSFLASTARLPPLGWGSREVKRE
jgi:hypothetical protein